MKSIWRTDAKRHINCECSFNEKEDEKKGKKWSKLTNEKLTWLNQAAQSKREPQTKNVTRNKQEWREKIVRNLIISRLRHRHSLYLGVSVSPSQVAVNKNQQKEKGGTFDIEALSAVKKTLLRTKKMSLCELVMSLWILQIEKRKSKNKQKVQNGYALTNWLLCMQVSV